MPVCTAIFVTKYNWQNVWNNVEFEFVPIHRRAVYENLEKNWILWRLAHTLNNEVGRKWPFVQLQSDHTTMVQFYEWDGLISLSEMTKDWKIEFKS